MTQNRRISEEHVFRLLPDVVPVEQLQVPKDTEDDERQGRNERQRVARGDRVERIGDDRRPGDRGEQLIDERDRVPLEHRAARRAVGADEHQLRPPLAERQEQRQQSRADEEPRRDDDIDGNGARGSTDHEEGRDRQHVDEHDMLQLRRVGRLKKDEADETEERGKAEPGDDGQCTERENGCEDDRRSGPQLAPGDRPAPLDGMAAVGGGVPHVVDEIGRARGGAVGDERQHGLEPADRIAELRGEDDPGEEQQVLHPLPWTECDERCHERRAAHRQLDDVGESGRLSHRGILVRPP